MPGLSRTVWPLPAAGLLLDCSATIWRRASPGLSALSPKPSCSRAIRLLSEVGLSLTPETAHGPSTKARTYLYGIYNIIAQKDKLSPHTHSWYKYIWHAVNTLYKSLTNIGLFPVKSEHKLTLPAPSRAALASMTRVTKDDARDPSRWHTIFPGSNTTLDKLLHYTYYIMRSVMRYKCSEYCPLGYNSRFDQDWLY